MARTSKVISIFLLLASIGFGFMSLQHSHSLLFEFASLNVYVSIIRLLLALALVWLTFGEHHFNSQQKERFLAGGLGFIAFGLIAGLDTAFGSVLYGYIMTLDVMILLETGVILCWVGLPSVGPVRAKAKAVAKTATKPRLAWQIHLPKLPKPQLTITIKVPRFTIF